MPFNVSNPNSKLEFQNYYDVCGTQINGGTVTLSTLLFEIAKQKNKLTLFFVADKRIVIYESPSTGESTKSGKSCVTNSKRTAERSNSTPEELPILKREINSLSITRESRRDR